jgi:hypothetical protein
VNHRIDQDRILDQAFEAAKNFPADDARMRFPLCCIGRRGGSFGKIRAVQTSAQFDATSTHPEWLG